MITACRYSLKKVPYKTDIFENIDKSKGNTFYFSLGFSWLTFVFGCEGEMEWRGYIELARMSDATYLVEDNKVNSHVRDELTKKRAPSLTTWLTSVDPL